jgi:Zn-dependent peptidase ImmA (M78 family)
MWIGTDAADFICYAQDTTPVHQRHIVAHEIGHMAFEHRGSAAGGEEIARLLFPDLSPVLVQSFLARSVYSDREELEAETFASVLLGRARPRPSTSGLRAGEAEVLRRVEGAFTPAQPSYGE